MGICQKVCDELVEFLHSLGIGGREVRLFANVALQVEEFVAVLVGRVAMEDADQFPVSGVNAD